MFTNNKGEGSQVTPCLRPYTSSSSREEHTCRLCGVAKPCAWIAAGMACRLLRSSWLE